MGRPIVYCDICGDRILDDEFEKRRAVTVQNKNYCANCARNVFGSSMPEAKPAPTHDRPPSSPSMKPGHAAHRPVHIAPRGSPSGLLIGAVAGGIALLAVIVLAVASRGAGTAEPAKPSGPSADDRALKAMTEIERLASPAITDPERVLKLASELRARVAGTASETRLTDIEALARKRLDEMVREKEVAKLVEELKLLLQTDTAFAQYDRFQELHAKAGDKAKGAGGGWSDAVFKVGTEYSTGFQQAATVKGNDLRQRADAAALEKRYAEAARLIDSEFTGVWRRSAAWPSLETRKKELEVLAAQPPDAPPPPPATTDRFGIVLGPAPKVGAWTTVVNGGAFEGMTRLPQGREAATNWSIANGELTGTSSYETDTSGNYADLLITLSNEYQDIEVEFTSWVVQGTLLVGMRYEPGLNNSQPKVAAMLVTTSGAWQKIRVVAEGGTGKIFVDGAEQPLDLSGGAAAGRLIFGLAAGSKIRMKDLRLLRKK